MSNIGDLMKRLDGTDGLSLGTVVLPSALTGLTPPVVNQAFDAYFRFDKIAADGTAATTTADTLFFTNPYDFTLYLTAASITCTGAGITGDATNNAVVTLKTSNGVVVTTAIAATLTTNLTDSGTITQNIGKNFVNFTAANIAIPANGGLWLNIAKNGTGVVVPVSFINARLRRGEY